MRFACSPCLSCSPHISIVPVSLSSSSPHHLDLQIPPSIQPQITPQTIFLFGLVAHILPVPPILSTVLNFFFVSHSNAPSNHVDVFGICFKSHRYRNTYGLTASVWRPPCPSSLRICHLTRCPSHTSSLSTLPWDVETRAHWEGEWVNFPSGWTSTNQSINIELRKLFKRPYSHLAWYILLSKLIIEWKSWPILS